MTVKTAKAAITALWGFAAIPLLLILIIRQLNGFYGSDAQAVWAWAAQFLFPILTLIGGAWSVAGSPQDNTLLSSKVLFWGAVVLSIFYLLVLYVILGIHTIKVFEESGMFLGVLQALVVGWLGKFFIEVKH